jgi:DinB superfamily
MKQLLVLPLLAAPMFAQTGVMNTQERDFLVDKLELSKKNFLASIAGVSAAQWKFKPAPNVWSVGECAEHIVLAEDFIFAGAQGILKTPAVDRPPSSNAQVDAMFWAGVQDRSQKFTAPEPITPGGTRFATPADAAKAFTEKRDAHIAYVKSTQDDLRVHVGDGPAGKMDAYQFIILLAGHSARHTLQIKEVQANAGYPKASANFPVTVDKYTVVVPAR